jgi:hypothetical protein
MAKSDKQAIITEMIVLLENGTNYGTCFKLNETKWNLTKSTFIRYWKVASESYNNSQNEAQRLIAEQSIEATLKRHNEAIINKEQRMEILSNMALGQMQVLKPMSVAGEVVEVFVRPDYNDRKNAIAELNKMDGSYAPIKQAPTDVDGNTLLQQQTIIIQPVKSLEQLPNEPEA